MAISEFDWAKARGDTGQQRESSIIPPLSILAWCRRVHLLYEVNTCTAPRVVVLLNLRTPRK